jgi:transcriptional regulator with XRE-family HTH domain
MLMEIVAQRLKKLRETMGISQARMAELMDFNQSTINRYENNQSSPPYEKIVWYADYFDVSLDYILGRTDEPRGKLYEFNPTLGANTEELRRFIEMCFDPTSPMNSKLKDTLMQMMTRGEDRQ